MGALLPYIWLSHFLSLYVLQFGIVPGQANPPCVVHYLSTTMTHQTETEQNSFGSLASQAIIT